MAGYLQRLLDTAAPEGAAAATLSPVVKSTSPVFENDQLLGLQAIVSGTTNSTETMPFIPAASTPASRTFPPASERGFANALSGGVIGNARYVLPLPAGEDVAGVPASPLPMAEVGEARLHEARRPVAPSDTAVNARIPALPQQVGQDRANPSREPVSRTLLTPQAPDHGSTGATEDSAALARLRAAQANVNLEPVLPRPPASPVQSVAEHLVVAEPRRRQSNIAATARATGEQPSQPRGVEIEPRPPRDIGRGPPEFPTGVSARADRAPRISIGRVTIEIVPETNPAAPPLRPLTAAAASQIGPLGQPRTARRLLALKRL